MSNITQRGATGPLAFQANSGYQQTTDANLATLVGTRWDLDDGREVILVSTSSTTTTTPGFLYQDAALIANHQNCAVTAFQAYSTNGNKPATVTITLGATALTANQYQGGYLIVNDGAGVGQTLAIAENPAALASATGVVITLEESPSVALTTSSYVCLVPGHGINVIVNPTTPTNMVAGIALYPIAPSSYGFLQTDGICSAVSDVHPAGVGIGIAPSITTAGTVTLATATSTALSSTVIGTSMYQAVSAKAYPVMLEL